MNTFPKHLKNLRNSKKLSMDEIVNKLNSIYEPRFNKTTWARWESGETSPSIDHASALAHFFGITLDELSKGTDGESSIAAQHKTFAAHIDDDVTEEEMEEIKRYLEYLKSKRK